MNFFFRFRESPVRLFVVAQILILVAFVWKDFPIFIFFSFAPVFALIDHPSGLKDSYLAFIVAIVTVFVLYFVMHMQRSLIISWVIYFAILGVLFVFYTLMQHLSKNAMNKFALVIFIMGTEYVLLKLMIEKNPVFLADMLASKPMWTRWNIYTGYTGTSLWILLTNLLFYQAIFKAQKIKWLFLFFGVTLVLGPIVYSLNIPAQALTRDDVVSLYSIQGTHPSNYSQHGELISRTGAWVSVLIIIFTLLKGQIKKGSR
jgi:apolipoprotein N-acyltransferase